MSAVFSPYIESMIPELGHFALILALFAAGAQIVPQLCRQAAVLQFALVLMALAALIWAYATFDFTVLAVAEHMHTLRPLAENVVAALGSPATLLLVLLVTLSFAGAIVAIKKPRPGILRLLGLAGFGLIALTLFVVNPFERIYPPPFDGVRYDPFAQQGGLP